MDTVTQLMEFVPLNLIVLISLICILILLLPYVLSPKNLPPGPVGLPIVGYLPWIYGKLAHSRIEKLLDKYGPLISLYLGSKLVVVLGTAELMHEAYVTQGDKFSGKPRDSPMEIDGDELGISICGGKIWKDQRRFVLKTLRDIGVGKQIIEPEIKEEIKCLLEVLKATTGKTICLHDYLGTSIANNICTLQFGKRFDYNDPIFKEMKHCLDELTFSLEVIHLPMYFPWINKIPLLRYIFRQDRKKKLKKELYSFTERILKQHEADFATNEHRDLIFAWMDERNDRLEKNNSEGSFTRDSLKFNLLSLFMAGTETANSTLLTGIAYMAKNPEIQTKCREEINTSIDKDRLPSIEDKCNLPYTEATLYEVQRLAGVNPLNLVHSTTEDAVLNRYFIPKDTIIMANLYGIHTNPNEWPNPFQFKPERFLSGENLNQVVNKDKILPFSIGKRMCLGANLAKLEVFLYFTALLQNFIFVESPDKPIKLEYHGGVVRTPKQFYVCINPI